MLRSKENVAATYATKSDDKLTRLYADRESLFMKDA